MRWLPKIHRNRRLKRITTTIDYPIQILEILLDYSKDKNNTIDQWMQKTDITEDIILNICLCILDYKESTDIPGMSIMDLLLDLLVASFSFSTYTTDVVAGTIKKKGFRCYETCFHILSLCNLERMPRIVHIFEPSCYVAICLVVSSIDHEHIEDYRRILSMTDGSSHAISRIADKILELRDIFPIDNVRDFIYKAKPELVGTLGNKKLI